MKSIPLVVEVYLVSDHSHTVGLRRRSLIPLEYMSTYMYKVSLLLQQLKPPIRIALVAYERTYERNVKYEKFTRTGDVDAHGTITKLRQYAAKSSSVHQSDLLVLIAGTRMVDASAPAGAPDLLGLAPIEGICSEYSVALVKDTAGRYTGVHSTAHEMGHSFGSDHDGEGTSAMCPAADGYIMTPGLEEKHSEEFSICSRTVISKYVTSPAAECLKYAASMKVIGVYARPIKPPRRGKSSTQS
ncbi:venom metalloproteinase antarease-like TpachMP_B isoform X2 [Rhipicephalus sanguineus]|nr:venom metalloproteinase antarease-like TpachMP_B isoform X2 [Rhipicephalus sanguineus]